ncbi:MAG: NUDIX domain-containing protein [Candidatus Saccharimonadales bacterium]
MTFVKLSPKQLREHKGKSFVGITVAFLCHDGKGNLLLSKRSQNARDERGRWDNGGGGLKHGEAVEAGLRREVKEEYSVEPISTEFINYFDVFRTDDDAQPTHWLAMCFAVLVDSSKVKIGEPDMIDELGWFTLDKLPSPMHSQFDVFMNLHGDNLRQILSRR